MVFSGLKEASPDFPSEVQGGWFSSQHQFNIGNLPEREGRGSSSSFIPFLIPPLPFCPLLPPPLSFFFSPFSSPPSLFLPPPPLLFSPSHSLPSPPFFSKSSPSRNLPFTSHVPAVNHQQRGMGLLIMTVLYRAILVNNLVAGIKLAFPIPDLAQQ